jgi:hypothetical protein
MEERMSARKSLPLLALAGLPSLGAPAQKANALTLSSPGAASAIQQDTREITTEAGGPTVGGTMAGVVIGAGIAIGDIIGAGDIVTVAGEEVSSLGDEMEEPRTWEAGRSPASLRSPTNPRWLAQTRHGRRTDGAMSSAPVLARLNSQF